MLAMLAMLAIIIKAFLVQFNLLQPTIVMPWR